MRFNAHVVSVPKKHDPAPQSAPQVQLYGDTMTSGPV